MEKLIVRTYRISKAHDKLVKKYAKYHGGESAYIRALIDQLEAVGIISPKDANGRRRVV